MEDLKNSTWGMGGGKLINCKGIGALDVELLGGGGQSLKPSVKIENVQPKISAQADQFTESRGNTASVSKLSNLREKINARGLHTTVESQNAKTTLSVIIIIIIISDTSVTSWRPTLANIGRLPRERTP